MKWLRFFDFFKCDTEIGSYVRTPPIPSPKKSCCGGRCVSTTPPLPPPPPKSNPIGRLTPIEYIDGGYSVEVYDDLLKDFIKIDSTNSEWYGRELIKDYHKNKEIKKSGVILVY